DADDTTMPAVAGDDDDGAGTDLEVGLDDLLRLRDNFGLFLLPAQVLGIQLLGQRPRFLAHRLVGRQQQTRGDVGSAHAAGGIHARRDDEADVVAVDLAAGQAADVEQRAKAYLVRSL